MSATDGIRVQQFDIAAIMGGLYGDGIIGLKGAFDHHWVQELGEDIEILFEDALKRPGGAVGRGPKRYYVEIHPENLRGFVGLGYPSMGRYCLQSHSWLRIQNR